MARMIEALFENRENAWVVKGRPDRNDLREMLRPGRSTRWVTRRPPSGWLEGDLVFYWEAAPRLAVCGIGELAAVDARRRDGSTTFLLRAMTPFLAKPTGIDALRDNRRIKNASFLKSGASGTVFPLSRPEALALASLVLAANRDVRVTTRQYAKRASTAGLALSIRQPWVELILRGVKVEEYRSYATHKRGRVLLYASQRREATEETEISRRRLDSSRLPSGVIAGSVEIVGCRRCGDGTFAWVLRRPRRQQSREPTNHPQPGYFRPWR